MRLRNTTAIKTAASPTIPGKPTSSANPVVGQAVDVASGVVLPPPPRAAIWVCKADTVASSFAESCAPETTAGVLTATTISGVFVGRTAAGSGVAVLAFCWARAVAAMAVAVLAALIWAACSN